MFHLEPIKNYNEMRVSIPTAESLKYEYVPGEYTNFENWLFGRYIVFLYKHGRKHYYWHYRFCLSIKNRKSEDLLFLIHVYQEHDGKPTDRCEEKFYNKLLREYRNEFEYLIRPKIELESKGKGIADVYAQAYYKKWLRQKTPNMKRLYHGVDSYEVSDLLRTISQIEEKEVKRIKNRIKYANKKAKKL